MKALSHPDWVRRFNLLGAAAGDGRAVVSLDADELLATARTATGLTDLGESEWPGWEEAYRCQLGAIDAEAELHLLGRVVTRAEVLRVLRTWLELQRAWQAAPAIGAGAIDEPLFVVGPPRTGTTILLELLALDPNLRAPIAYEALYPLAASGSVEQRLTRSECEQEFWADVHPEFMTMHELASDLPCECVHFLMYDFSGPYWGMLYDAPTATTYQLEHLETLGRLYRLHRRMLQTFRHEAPDARPRRWLLKSPFHISTLPALFTEYPDARVVHTHRDPCRFLPSLVSLLAAVRFMRSDAVDVDALAPVMQATYQMFLDGAIRARADGTVPDDRVVDSHFVDLMRDPVTALHSTYEQLGLEWPAGHDSTIRAYLGEKPRGKHGTHSYTPADVGLDTESVRASFAGYVAHYGIAEE